MEHLPQRMEAVHHMSQMFEDTEILKNLKKEAETSVLIPKMLAGQALSPIEARVVTDATTKVVHPCCELVWRLTAELFRT